MFFCMFSLLRLHLFFDESFSTDKGQAEHMGGGLFWEGLRGSCSVTQPLHCSFKTLGIFLLRDLGPAVPSVWNALPPSLRGVTFTFLKAVLTGISVGPSLTTLWKMFPFPALLIPSPPLFSFPQLPNIWHIAYRHTLFNCAWLYCASQLLLFNKLKVCDSPALSKSIGAIFPAIFAHFTL